MIEEKRKAEHAAAAQAAAAAAAAAKKNAVPVAPKPPPPVEEVPFNPGDLIYPQVAAAALLGVLGGAALGLAALAALLQCCSAQHTLHMCSGCRYSLSLDVSSC